MNARDKTLLESKIHYFETGDASAAARGALAAVAACMRAVMEGDPPPEVGTLPLDSDDIAFLRSIRLGLRGDADHLRWPGGTFSQDTGEVIHTAYTVIDGILRQHEGGDEHLIAASDQPVGRIARGWVYEMVKEQKQLADGAFPGTVDQARQRVHYARAEEIGQIAEEVLAEASAEWDRYYRGRARPPRGWPVPQY